MQLSINVNKKKSGILKPLLNPKCRKRKFLRNIDCFLKMWKHHLSKT